MGCKTEPLRSPPTSNFSRGAEFETVGPGIENALAGFAVRIKTADLDDITSSGKKSRYQFRLPIQTAIRQCQETTLQIHQKEVEIVRYGISAGPHARDVQTQGHGPAADIENILVGGLRQVCTAPRERESTSPVTASVLETGCGKGFETGGTVPRAYASGRAVRCAAVPRGAGARLLRKSRYLLTY